VREELVIHSTRMQFKILQKSMTLI